MNDSQITIQDIECPTLRGQVKGLMEDLIQLCPSDATIRASISKIHDRFMAEFRCASESCIMQANDQASAIGEVMDHIRSQMMYQIELWRAQRFAS